MGSDLRAERASTPVDRAVVRRRRLRRRAPRTPVDETAKLEELRSTFFGPERARIQELESRPSIDAQSVGAILPEAVALATAERERELAIGLEPTVTRAVTLVARNRPDLYAEALAPTIGAAVKKAVTEAIAAMLERFDLALERSLSLRSLRWRVEAKRTGRPFAEVVMLHTLTFRVEQVFLIHAPTSLVLLHLTDPVLPTKNPDQVAALLSAIDSFGREAFAPVAPADHLRRFAFGDLEVWVAREEPLVLATVVRGTTTSSLREQISDTLARVRITCQEGLADFAGDVSPFEPARPALEPLVRAERQAPKRRGAVVLAVVAGLLVVLVAGFVWRSRSHAAAALRRQQEVIETLTHEPGIVVEHVTSAAGQPHVTGFRDPLARQAEDVLDQHGLTGVSLSLVPFVSLDPQIVQRRAAHVLEVPEGVTLAMHDGRLVISGVAERRWIERAEVIARAIPGVDRVELAAVRPRESVDVARATAEDLAQAKVPSFAVGGARLAEELRRALAHVAETARRALAAAAEARTGACLDVVGHADATGDDDRNRALSLERAARAADELRALGVDPAALRVTGAERTTTVGSEARTVTFRLDIDETQRHPDCGASR